MSTSAMEDESEQKMESMDSRERESEEEDGRPTYLPLDELSTVKISANEIKKLRENGYHTVESVAYVAQKILQEIKGLSEAKVLKLQEAGIHSLNTQSIINCFFCSQ